jgi:hypothetical protein
MIMRSCLLPEALGFPMEYSSCTDLKTQCFWLTPHNRKVGIITIMLSSA